MNPAVTRHLIEQLRTGLVQPEELTEPEVAEVLALTQQDPATVPAEVANSLRRRQGMMATAAGQ